MRGVSIRSGRSARLALVVAVVAAIAAGCGSASSSSSSTSKSGGGSSAAASGKASTVKVTVIGDLTGPTASTQVPYVDGVRAALGQYNKALSGSDHPISATYNDDKYNPTTDVTDWKAAVEGGSVLMIGPNQSESQPAMIKLGLKTPLLSGITTTITNNAYLWNLLPQFTYQAGVMAAYAKTKVQGPLKAAALVYSVPSGLQFAAALQKYVTQDGGTYLGTVKIDPADAAGNWSAQAQALAQLKPNFVGFLGSGADPQTFLPAMNNAGLTNTVVGGVTPALLYKATWTKTPKGLAENYFGASSISPSDIPVPGASQVASAAQAAGNPSESDNLYFVQGYVATQVAIKAINTAGANPTAQSVNAAIGKLGTFLTGGLNPPLCLGSSVHNGTNLSRPLYVNLDTGKYVAVGSFAQWASKIGVSTTC